MIRATTVTSTTRTSMVDRFSANQDNITSSSFYGNWGLFQFDFLCQLARLFIRPEQHIQDKRDQREGHNGPQDAPFPVNSLPS